LSLLLNKNRLNVNKRNINFIDKIKVDIEGYELEFLQGINKKDFLKIGSFIIEVENYRNNYTINIINILESNNFSYKFSKNNKSNWIMIYAKNNLYTI
jgi:hypothetical protein